MALLWREHFLSLTSKVLDAWISASDPGTSLVIQWLRLHAPNAGGRGSIPGQGTTSHMLQLRLAQKEIFKDKQTNTPNTTDPVVYVVHLRI